MSKKRILCIILAALNLICVSVICVLAAPEDVPVSDVPVVSQPVSSQPVDIVTSVPVSEPTTVIGSDVTPSDSTSVSGVTEPTSASSTNVTGPTETSVVPSTPRPTEYQENPSIDFEIQTPVLVKPDENKDNSAKDWENIDENELIKDTDSGKLSVNDDNSTGGGFGFDKGSVSLEDEKNPLFFIVAIVCWFIALGLLTFTILFGSAQMSKKKAPARPSEKKRIKP